MPSLPSRMSFSGSSEPSFSDEVGALCPKLTYTQRLYGFVCCFVLGFLLSLFSFVNFVELLQGDPVPFVVMYTLGNILALASSMFLCGPKGQWKNMSKEGRRVTSIVYVLSLLVTLVVCFLTFPDDLRALQALIIIVCLVLQFGAMVWYSLSYIPYGRATAKSCCVKYCCCDLQVS